MIFPSVVGVLNVKRPDHSFNHHHYYQISSGHAGDIAEHMFLRAMETGRFQFAEGMISLFTHWLFVEKEERNKLRYGRDPLTLSECIPCTETYPSAWVPRSVPAEFTEMIAHMSTLTFKTLIKLMMVNTLNV